MKSEVGIALDTGVIGLGIGAFATDGLGFCGSEFNGRFLDAEEDSVGESRFVEDDFG
jgi:hypothetical protein